jgi:aldehyde:ferredoxin oxidoreductase
MLPCSVLVSAMNKHIRYLLQVDMSSGQCGMTPLPARYAGLGGRALASAIVRERVRPADDPLGVAAVLVLAPGLLGADVSPRPRRLAVGCKSPRDGSLGHGSTGGLAGECLAALGIAAVVINGKAPPGERRELLIGPQGARLGPWPAREDAQPPSPATLQPQYVEREARIGVGPAGERQLPTACLSLSDKRSQAWSIVCAGGAGAVMGSKGLMGIRIRAGKEEKALHRPGANVFCPADCPVRCYRKDGDFASAPETLHGIASQVRRQTGLEDSRRVEAFNDLCNTLVVDAFAVAEACGVALNARDETTGAELTARFDRLLDEMRQDSPEGRALASGPEAARRFYGVAGSSDTARPFASPKRGASLPDRDASLPDRDAALPDRDSAAHARRVSAALMDSLGLCRFAVQTALEKPGALDDLALALSRTLGMPMDAATLLTMAEETLRVEQALVDETAIYLLGAVSK